MKFVNAISVVCLLASAMMMSTLSASDEILISQPIVIPYQARALQVEQELASVRAEVVGIRADLAICQANTEQARREVQSLTLTNDVANAIKGLQEKFPGSQWVWDNEKRRIVPVKPEPPEEKKK